MFSYYINGKPINRKAFFSQLRENSVKTTETEIGDSGLGVELRTFDPKTYNRNKRAINSGRILVFMGSGQSFQKRRTTNA